MQWHPPRSSRHAFLRPLDRASRRIGAHLVSCPPPVLKQLYARGIDPRRALPLAWCLGGDGPSVPVLLLIWPSRCDT